MHTTDMRPLKCKKCDSENYRTESENAQNCIIESVICEDCGHRAVLNILDKPPDNHALNEFKKLCESNKYRLF